MNCHHDYYHPMTGYPTTISTNYHVMDSSIQHRDFSIQRLVLSNHPIQTMRRSCWTNRSSQTCRYHSCQIFQRTKNYYCYFLAIRAHPMKVHLAMMVHLARRVCSKQASPTQASPTLASPMLASPMLVYSMPVYPTHYHHPTWVHSTMAWYSNRTVCSMLQVDDYSMQAHSNCCYDEYSEVDVYSCQGSSDYDVRANVVCCHYS